MTFSEIRDKRWFAVSEADRICRKQMLGVIQSLGLSGKVVRKKDGRIGWLDVDGFFSICFYPQKKDGTRSINASGYVGFSEENLLEGFEPLKEGD